MEHVAEKRMMSVAELATALDQRRAELKVANDRLETAKDDAKQAADLERYAYKAFNEAVAAMRPKRKAKAVKP